MSETQETNPVQDLIQYSIDKDYTQASKTFGDIMTIKLNDLLDQEKIRLSEQIYNGVKDEPEEGEQLDLDLDGGDEEVPDESSEVEDSNEEDAGIDDETEDESEETEEEEE